MFGMAGLTRPFKILSDIVNEVEEGLADCRKNQIILSAEIKYSL
jgi:hypothetical protein